MSIITKKGDGGKTSLRYGKSVSKSDLRVEAYGTVDELSSAIGFARALLNQENASSEYCAKLLKIQSQLLSVGGDLATSAHDHATRGNALFKNEFLDWLDSEAAELQKHVRMDGFVLPGETMVSGSLHVARTVCRRAERCVIRLIESGEEPAVARMLPYLNRLSDFLWLLGEKTARP